AAAARMLARIRQQAWRDLRIDWGAEAAWQGALPLCAFGGDTLAVFAGVRGDASAPVRLLARVGGVDVTLAAAATRTLATDDALPRVAAAGRLGALDDEAATALALAYQLMSPHTNCVLVHLRAAADKTQDEAELHRVEAMLAAGWGGTGSVMESARAAAMPSMAAPMAGGAAASPKKRARRMDAFDAAEFRDDIFGAMPSHVAAPFTAFPSVLAGLAGAIADHLWTRPDLPALMAHCQALGIAQAVRDALAEVMALGVDEAQAWALLVRWLDERTGSTVSQSAPAALRLRLQRLDADVFAQATAIFARQLLAVAAAV
ncbi:MAG: hypothetical protein ABJD97_16480, partial [Betaproteobacteria bacterium]